MCKNSPDTTTSSPRVDSCRVALVGVVVPWSIGLLPGLMMACNANPTPHPWGADGTSSGFDDGEGRYGGQDRPTHRGGFADASVGSAADVWSSSDDAMGGSGDASQAGDAGGLDAGPAPDGEGSQLLEGHREPWGGEGAEGEDDA